MWVRLIFMGAGIGIGMLAKTELGQDVIETLKKGSRQLYDEVKEEVEEFADNIKDDLKDKE